MSTTLDWLNSRRDEVHAGAQDTLVRRALQIACVVYVCALGATVLGIAWGHGWLELCELHGSSARAGFLATFANWDGEWYTTIVERGYKHAATGKSEVPFFPLYPLLAAAVAWVTGMGTIVSLLTVSHAALAGCFFLLALYVRERFPAAPRGTAWLTVFALAAFPPAFFHRLAYSESTFLCGALLALYGMVRRWNPALIALAIGLATAARPVSVALLPAFALYLWRHELDSSRVSHWCLAVLLLCIASSGLLGYMFFLGDAFGDPLAFVHVQTYWHDRPPPASGMDWLVSHATLEPLRDVYDPSCKCCWRNDPPYETRLLNMTFMNPIYFLGVCSLVAWGGMKRLLTVEEFILSFGLLAAPYFTHAYPSCGASLARYASVVFPVYIVLGHILVRMPRAISIGLLLSCFGVQTVYAALFASWFWYF